MKWLFNENTKTLIIALFVVLLIRSSIAAPYKIPTGSMRPTLKIGDHIFVSKLSYGLKLPFTNYNLVTWSKPKRGDVIVFKYPVDPSKDFIKRVVGIPGDTIEFEDGHLVVNGEIVSRKELSKEDFVSTVDDGLRDSRFFKLYLEDFNGEDHFIMERRESPYGFKKEYEPYRVKEGEYFVMGDNRDNSRDSREWGEVKFDNIRGRALVVFFSLRKRPLGVRWERFGQVIK